VKDEECAGVFYHAEKKLLQERIKAADSIGLASLCGVGWRNIL
jgi:hypothetical protein